MHVSGKRALSDGHNFKFPSRILKSIFSLGTKSSCQGTRAGHYNPLTALAICYRLLCSGKPKQWTLKCYPFWSNFQDTLMTSRCIVLLMESEKQNKIYKERRYTNRGQKLNFIWSIHTRIGPFFPMLGHGLWRTWVPPVWSFILHTLRRKMLPLNLQMWT